MFNRVGGHVEKASYSRMCDIASCLAVFLLRHYTIPGPICLSHSPARIHRS